MSKLEKTNIVRIMEEKGAKIVRWKTSPCDKLYLYILKGSEMDSEEVRQEIKDALKCTLMVKVVESFE